MQEQDVERFRLSARWLHWIVTASFLILAVTGLFLYIPQLGVVAQDSYTRLIHRIASVIFIAAPLIYFLTAPKNTLSFLKEILTWGKDDIDWIKAAPDYYFGGEAGKMPPQGAMNTGQKLWALVSVVGGIGFLITGIIMWAFKGESSGLFLASVYVHDICFIIVGAFMLLHAYLGALHPRMTESMRSMITGKVSVEYAKSHHGKWLKKNLGVTIEEEAPSANREGEG